MSTRQEREKENREYLKNKVDQHLNKLIIELLKQKPENVLNFINEWSAKQLTGEPAIESQPETINAEDCPREERGNYDAPDVISDDDEEGDEVAELDNFAKQGKKMSTNQRSSVSAEVFGMNNLKQNYTPVIVEKSQDAKDRISKRLGESFMFSALDAREKGIVLNAMKEQTFEKDDVVIKQGDDGEVLFCVDSGKLDCHRKMNKDDEYPGTFLKAYTPGESFGELALLYNAPRAATIIASESSVCFSLDRDCFNNIVKDATIKRRERFEGFLNKIELLMELDAYEKGQLSDVLTVENYAEGDVVIKQGDVGTKFYLIEEGTANAVKTNDENAEEIVFQYSENDYFGELALLKDEPRAATIKATSAMKLAWVDRGSFKRLLGSLETVLERNTEKYNKFVKSE